MSEARSPARGRYSSVAIALHWAIAVLILFNLLTGFFHDRLPGILIVFHISSGITVMALTAVRVIWRLTHRRPAYPPHFKTWERHLAKAVHLLLYAGMVILPLSGWAMISANPPAGSPGATVVAAERAARHKPPRRAGAPRIWFLLPLPPIAPISEIGRFPQGIEEQRALHERIETIHLLGGWAMLLLFVLHVSGALKHQFIDRYPSLARMGIGRMNRDFDR